MTGAVLDRAFSNIHALDSLPSMAKVLLQFGGGVVILGAASRAMVPRNQTSPIGDGILIYFFYNSQPNMFREIAALRGDLVGNMSKMSMEAEYHKPSALQSSTFKNVDAY